MVSRPLRLSATLYDPLMVEDKTRSGADEIVAPTARTRHGSLSLDEIGALMPGLGTLMPIISDRFGWMYHAGQGGNWKLAHYQLRKIRHLFNVGMKTRPKWTSVIDAYLKDYLEPIGIAIEANDPTDFLERVGAAVDEANRIHGQYNYGYIVYRLPAEGPDHMQLEPIDEDSELPSR